MSCIATFVTFAIFCYFCAVNEACFTRQVFRPSDNVGSNINSTPEQVEISSATEKVDITSPPEQGEKPYEGCYEGSACGENLCCSDMYCNDCCDTPADNITDCNVCPRCEADKNERDEWGSKTEAK